LGSEVIKRQKKKTAEKFVVVLVEEGQEFHTSKNHVVVEGDRKRKENLLVEA
jgi:ribosomal protein S4E